jgi:hypothetical protein
MICDEDIPFHPPARKASSLSDEEWLAMGWHEDDGEGLPPKPNLPPFDPGFPDRPNPKRETHDGRMPLDEMD